MGSYKAKQMANSKAAKAKQLQKKGKDEEPPVKAKQQPPEPPRDARAAARKRGAPEPEGERPYQPETSELEKKRLGVADELRKVEQQVRTGSDGKHMWCNLTYAALVGWWKDVLPPLGASSPTLPSCHPLSRYSTLKPSIWSSLARLETQCEVSFGLWCTQ